MKDPVFSGKDVAEAVRLASRTLAVPEASLRYFVLEQGQPGGRGLSATEARIAVLLDAGTSGAAAVGPDPGAASEAEAEWEAARGRGRSRRSEVQGAPSEGVADPESCVRELVSEIARAAGVALEVEFREVRGDVEVRLEGSGTSVLFDPEGAAVAALEHVVERVYGKTLGGRRVRLRCAGYREYRDEQLRQQAFELAEKVRGDGQPRTSPALNAYERRLIHVALEGDEGVVTFSVGEGHARRVTVAPREARTTEGAAPATETAAQADVGDAPAEGSTAPGGAQESPQTRESGPAPFDALQFDRPPEGGGASELM